MKTFDFASIIDTYEKKRKNVIYEKRQTKNEEEIIKIDIDSTFQKMSKINNHKTMILRRILFDVLILMPIAYVQGMNEICSIFIYYYFNDEFETAEEDEEIIVNEELLKQTRITITNILIDKYLPLIMNDFSLYSHYNDVFVAMMKKRGIELHPSYSLKYMNITLTWFTRLVSNYEMMKTLVGFIITCPVSMPFLLLIRFLDKAENNEMITETDQGLFEQLIALEREFIDTEAILTKEKPFFGNKMGIFGGALIVALLVVLFIVVLKKKDE